MEKTIQNCTHVPKKRNSEKSAIGNKKKILRGREGSILFKYSENVRTKLKQSIIMFKLTKERAKFFFILWTILINNFKDFEEIRSK